MQIIIENTPQELIKFIDFKIEYAPNKCKLIIPKNTDPQSETLDLIMEIHSSNTNFSQHRSK